MGEEADGGGLRGGGVTGWREGEGWGEEAGDFVRGVDGELLEEGLFVVAGEGPGGLAGGGLWRGGVG